MSHLTGTYAFVARGNETETGKSYSDSEYIVLGLAGRCVSVTVHLQMSVNEINICILSNT